MRKYVKPILLIIVSLISVFIAAIAVMIYLHIFHFECIKFSSSEDIFGMNYLDLMSSYEIPVYLISTAITLFFALGLKMADLHKAYDTKAVDWKNAWIPILGAIFLLFVMNSCIEICFDDVTFEADEVFLRTFGGIIATTIFEAFYEEMLFRESIMRYLYNSGATNRQAIIFSTICSSLLSVRPSILVFNLTKGLLFASIYAKTRNIIITTIIHGILYCAYFIMFCIYNGGYDYVRVYVNVISIVVFSYPSYRLLRSFFKDEPVIPSILWFKMKRLMVKVK